VIHVGPELNDLKLLVLYVGPDQILPLGSALAAITGFLLLFWQRVKIFWQKFVRLFSKSGVEAEPSRVEVENAHVKAETGPEAG